MSKKLRESRVWPLLAIWTRNRNLSILRYGWHCWKYKMNGRIKSNGIVLFEVCKKQRIYNYKRASIIVAIDDDGESRFNRYSKAPLTPHHKILIGKLQRIVPRTPFAGYSGRARFSKFRWSGEATSLLYNSTLKNTMMEKRCDLGCELAPAAVANHAT